jgi:formylglycine-generating enzyme required for sulfatase activity
MWAFGNVFDRSRANTSESGKGTTTSIRTYAPNSYGLYDMSGNAMEWVEDWYDAAFYRAPEASQMNPLNRHKDGGRRVQRGGAWWHGIEGVRTTRRYWSLLDDISTLVGFRCARSLTLSPDS